MYRYIYIRYSYVYIGNVGKQFKPWSIVRSAVQSDTVCQLDASSIPSA